MCDTLKKEMSEVYFSFAGMADIGIIWDPEASQSFISFHGPVSGSHFQSWELSPVVKATVTPQNSQSSDVRKESLKFGTLLACSS